MGIIFVGLLIGAAIGSVLVIGVVAYSKLYDALYGDE